MTIEHLCVRSPNVGRWGLGWSGGTAIAAGGSINVRAWERNVGLVARRPCDFLVCYFSVESR